MFFENWELSRSTTRNAEKTTTTKKSSPSYEFGGKKAKKQITQQDRERRKEKAEKRRNFSFTSSFYSVTKCEGKTIPQKSSSKRKVKLSSFPQN